MSAVLSANVLMITPSIATVTCLGSEPCKDTDAILPGPPVIRTCTPVILLSTSTRVCAPDSRMSSAVITVTFSATCDSGLDDLVGVTTDWSLNMLTNSFSCSSSVCANAGIGRPICSTINKRSDRVKGNIPNSLESDVESRNMIHFPHLKSICTLFLKNWSGKTLILQDDPNTYNHINNCFITHRMSIWILPESSIATGCRNTTF